MRAPRIALLLLPLSLALATAATAAPHRAVSHPASTSPKKLGDFNDWTAATYDQGGRTVCYAFSRAEKTSTDIGRNGILTVTELPTMRDSVAIEAGFAFAPKATGKLEVGDGNFDLYTAQHNAYARDSKAVVAAFSRGAKAIAHLPGPHDKPVTESYSLIGFSAAHAAILKACPAK